MLKLTVAEAAKITGTQDVSKPDTAITAAVPNTSNSFRY